MILIRYEQQEYKNQVIYSRDYNNHLMRLDEMVIVSNGNNGWYHHCTTDTMLDCLIKLESIGYKINEISDNYSIASQMIDNYLITVRLWELSNDNKIDTYPKPKISHIITIEEE